MSSLKFLAAAVVAATASLAFAQSTPPQPATNPAVGAGQRSTQNTPMGTTGTPGGGGAAAQGSTAGSTAGSTGAASSSGSMSSGSTAGAAAGSSGTGSTTMAAGTGSGGSKSSRRARADRN